MRISGHHNHRGKFKVSWTREFECGFYSRFGNLTFLRVEKFQFGWPSWSRPDIVIIYTIYFPNGGTFSLFLHSSIFEVFLKFQDMKLITQHSKRLQCDENSIPIHILFDKPNKSLCHMLTPYHVEVPNQLSLETSAKASPTSNHHGFFFSTTTVDTWWKYPLTKGILVVLAKK